MPSKELLLRRFQAMEAERRTLLQGLERYAPELLERAPAPGQWSVAQVILHLAIAEEGTLAYLTKKLQHGKHRPAPSSSVLRLALLQLALWLPVKYKAPAVVANVPAVSYPEACARWEAVRMRMLQTYTQLPEPTIGHDLFKHPSAGRFHVVQGLSFIGMHIAHHRRQLKRILRQVQQ